MKIRRVIIIIALIIILAILAFNFKFTITLPSKIFNYMTLAPIRISSIIFRKTTDFFSIIIHIKDLKNENSELYLSNRLLNAENVKLKEVFLENEFLRQALNLEKEHKYTLIPARVIGRDPAMFSDSVIIDAGENYGIQEGMAAISYGGIILGQVKTVDSSHSQVMPITASGESINVITQESRVDGILKGEYGTSLVLELIPQDTEIRVGENIITSGINNRIPKGILIGYIQSVNGEPNDPFKKAKVIANAKLNREEWVYIVQQ